MYHRGSFREDVNKRFVSSKNSEYGMKHVINKCNL